MVRKRAMTQEEVEEYQEELVSDSTAISDARETHGSWVAGSKPAIVDADAAPEWIRRRFIVRGYRINHRNYLDCFRSLFKFHNETLNIWIHVVASILFIYYGSTYLWPDGVQHGVPRDSESFMSTYERQLVALYLFGVAVCFSGSSYMHSCKCTSADNYVSCNIVDYEGILVEIFVTLLSYTSLVMRCNERLRNAYIIVLVSLLIPVAALTTQHWFHSRRNKWLRIGSYVAVAVLYPTVVTLHSIKVYDITYVKVCNDEMRVLGTGFLRVLAVMVVALVFFIARIPERWFPRLFDIVGQSHNWWHVLVSVGAYQFFLVLLDAIRLLHDADGDTCPVEIS